MALQKQKESELLQLYMAQGGPQQSYTKWRTASLHIQTAVSCPKAHICVEFEHDELLGKARSTFWLIAKW